MATKRNEVDAVRHFNRYYTARLGLLNRSHLGSGYSLTEVRTIYEIGNSTGITARAISTKLHIDEGYLSRLLAVYEEKGYLKRNRSKEDRRKYFLSLTKKGERLRTKFDKMSSEHIEQLLDPLADSARKRVVENMREIEGILRAVDPLISD